MKTTRVCLSALLVVLAGFPCAAQSLTPLASVHTWGDLRAQPPVTIPAAASGAASRDCQLGINLAAAKLYGGVVVYCLAQNKPVTAAASTNFGPLEVEVQRPKAAQMIQADQQVVSLATQQGGDEVLFMKSVPLNQPGDYTITVKRPLNDAKGGTFESVASIVVSVADEPGPVWSPWPLNSVDGAVGLLASDDEYQRNSGVSGVANPSTGSAIPKMAESFVVGVVDNPSADHPLPELSPAEPAAGVKLQAVGSLLIVTLDHGITPAFPDEKFLTRWWINGQPFTPKLTEPAHSSMYFMRHNGLMSSNLVTQITFEVEFHPEILGAKIGDQIGVELLLCPHGSEYSGPDPTMQMFRGWEPADPDIRSVEARLSNRVTFAYTGDPIRMAPLAR